MKEKELRAAVFKFARSRSLEFKFPSTLTKAQRHIVHVAAQQKGLLHATVGNPCAIVLRKNITESASPEVSVVDGVSTPRKMAAQSDPAGTPEKNCEKAALEAAAARSGCCRGPTGWRCSK